MNTTIRKIGNSEGLIIPKELLEKLGFKAGDSVELSADHGGLLIKAQDDDFQRQVTQAEKFMDRYKVALKKLAE